MKPVDISIVDGPMVLVKTVELVPAIHGAGTSNHGEFLHFSNLHIFSATNIEYEKDALNSLDCIFHGMTNMTPIPNNKARIRANRAFSISFKSAIKFLKVSGASAEYR